MLKKIYFYAYIKKKQQIMEDLVTAAKIILFVSIVNVWFFRASGVPNGGPEVPGK